MFNSDSTRDSGAKDVIVPTDREGKLLKLTSICDLRKTLQEFRNCMQRNSHGAVLEEASDAFPIRPTEAFNRRDVADWQDAFTADDQKSIDNFIRQNYHWQASLNAAVPAFLKMLDSETLAELELLMGQQDINRLTQANLFAMINAIDNRYGGWNSNKGDRNYLEIMGIPIFSTRALAQSGLLTLKEKRTERTGWNDLNHLYALHLVSNPANYNELFDETCLVRSAMVDLEYELVM